MLTQARIEKIPFSLVRESLLLMRVDRGVGTWLLLWPGLWSLLAASQGFPDFRLFLIITVGTFIMRSAGCVANDLADRNFDPHVARTRMRPLARKAIPVSHALALLVILLFIALFLGMQLGAYVLALCVPGAFLALSYPFTKRFLHAPQLYLGVAFGWSVIIAWAAVRGTLDWPAWLLFFATICWATGYDTIYGMVDKKDDIKIGIKSTALLFGDHAWLAVAAFYLLTLTFLAFSGYLLHYTSVFYSFILLAFLHFSFQIVQIRNIAPSSLLSVFTSNRWTGGIICLGFVFEKISF
ncbi:MAG: 4-hydroxybenzoate octaprenyltransferase [Magnetococcales bacterium]|nr:4-hydroxybenzoate octaprenyltransferase [Magnetococcales bacterium]